MLLTRVAADVTEPKQTPRSRRISGVPGVQPAAQSVLSSKTVHETQFFGSNSSPWRFRVLI
jgi:hypothetical protein